jgi:site-specific DNA-cytosine methylase
MKVLELFSGVGGMRMALAQALTVPYSIISAFDINTAANDVYNFNFKTKVSVVCGLSFEILLQLSRRLVLLLCAPHTKQCHAM